MPDSRLAERFGELVDLTAGETAALAALERRERSLRRGTALIRENERLSDLFVLRRGTMMSYVLLDDGSRQILRFLFPGDILASFALAYERARATIVATSDAVVSPIDRSAIAALTVEHPRLAALLMVVQQIERAGLADRVAAMGRTSAKSRIAALLLDIRSSQRLNDKGIGSTFALGLTQEEIGDATGLTAVHVNRMIRKLEEDGLITRQNGAVTLIDEARLARAANHVDRFEGLDLSWLPEPR